MSAELDLWLCDVKCIDDDVLIDEYRSILDASELAKEQFFRFPADRLRYLVTRALARTVLSRYVETKPYEWEFSTSPFGRPVVVNAGFGLLDIHFNISHTQDMIIMAVSRGGEVGIDIETIRPDEPLVDEAQRFFAPAEIAALNKVPTSQKAYRFFEYWTFKESYIKALGMGIYLPLDKFAFHFPDDYSVAIEIEADLHDRAESWHFFQFMPTSSHLVAVCAQSDGVPIPSLHIRQIVPQREVVALDVQILRKSANSSTGILNAPFNF